MEKSRLLAAGLIAAAGAVGGCKAFIPPHVGMFGMLADSGEHRAYLEEIVKGDVEREQRAMIESFVKNEEREFCFENGSKGSFRVMELDSGSRVASWEGGTKGSAVFCNGLGSSAYGLGKMGRSFIDQGISLYALDRTGSGLNVDKNADVDSWVEDAGDLSSRLAKPAIISQCFSTGVVAEIVDRHPEKFSKVIYLTPSFELNYGVCPLVGIQIGLGRAFGFDHPHKNPVPIKAYTSNEIDRKSLSGDPFFSYKPGCLTMVAGNDLTKEAVEKINRSKIPVYFILASDDRVVDNRKTLKKLDSDLRRGIIVNVESDHYVPFDMDGTKKLGEVILNGN
jgi:alpha-beta hydrolase superfamily lysophospholipase